MSRVDNALWRKFVDIIRTYGGTDLRTHYMVSGTFAWISAKFIEQRRTV